MAIARSWKKMMTRAVAQEGALRRWENKMPERDQAAHK
jgi:hypothetical protein